MDDQAYFGIQEGLIIRVVPYTLKFLTPAKTSRDTMFERNSWIIAVATNQNPEKWGYGEVAPIQGLSKESETDVAELLELIQQESFPLEMILNDPHALSSVKCGLETALLDLKNGGNLEPFVLSDTTIKDGIAINGLVWMNSIKVMSAEALQKMSAGFDTIKLKIGALGFEEELGMLHLIRSWKSKEALTIRLDANGVFEAERALSYLEDLSRIDIHSIEQPIAAGQWGDLKKLIAESPIPIALDEELIGVESTHDKIQLLDELYPHYLILKPSLHGGFKSCDEWIRLAEERNIGWWATSALESSIGLNAIARWVQQYRNPLPQGLGTGALYSNNITSPWKVKEGRLKWDREQSWDFSPLKERTSS